LNFGITAAWRKTVRARKAVMQAFFFVFGRFHLNRQMVDAEFIVQIFSDFPQKFGRIDPFVMNDVNAQGFHTGSYRPDVQIVDVSDIFVL
jgi:hypothetical protein